MSPVTKFLKGFSFIIFFCLDFSISETNSSTDPMIISSPLVSLLHIGRGTPQNLDLDRFQSLIFSSHFTNLFSPIVLGFHRMDLFNSTILRLLLEVLINHESSG